jgi:hypothetical protein
MMMQDNWIHYPGGMSNHPLPIKGEVVDSWSEVERDDQLYYHVKMSTGEQFKRHHVYDPRSPYGWEKVVE